MNSPIVIEQFAFICTFLLYSKDFERALFLLSEGYCICNGVFTIFREFFLFAIYMYFMNMLLVYVSVVSIISLTGKWLPEEEKRLCDAVYELSGTKQGNHCFTVADIIVFFVKYFHVS